MPVAGYCERSFEVGRRSRVGALEITAIDYLRAEVTAFFAFSTRIASAVRFCIFLFEHFLKY